MSDDARVNAAPACPAERRRRARLTALLLASATVAASCGGGGGGGGGGSPSPGPGTPPPPPSGPQTTISGVAEFQSVPNNSSTGALDYAAAAFKPIRGATVELVDSLGVTLATGTTGTTGSFTLGPVNMVPMHVRVRAEAKRSGASGGTYDVSVRDNTNSDALYTLDSAPFTPTANAETHDVQAASGWGGTQYTGVRAAAPFAILDSVYQATQKVLSVSPNQTLPPLRMFWSVNNRPATGGGGPPVGNIGTSFYDNNANSGHGIYVLGAENTDTDEYDQHVVAHEWGHYLQGVLSRDDSPAGDHVIGDRLDMTVAFSEGWGNAWAAIALTNPLYADSSGSEQAAGFIDDVSIAPTNSPGWYKEESVQYLFWSWHQDNAIGFAPLFNVLTGPLRTSNAMSAIHNFASLLKAAVPGAVASIDALLANQQIASSDALGSGETNGGGVALALPVYNNYSGGTQRYCTTDEAGRFNKLGMYKYIRFTTATAGSRTITVTAVAPPTPTDPDFRLVQSDGGVVLGATGTPDSEIFTGDLPAGTHTLALVDFNMQNATSPTGQRCFDFQVQ